MVKHLPAIQEFWVGALGQGNPLEKGVATHSSILAWRIPGTEEPGRLQSIASRRVRLDLATEQTSQLVMVVEKAMATHSSILAWRIPGTEEPGGLQPIGCKESDTTEQLTHTHTQ